MFSLLLASPLLLAPQQDLSLRLDTDPARAGAITSSASFAFSCGWEVDANGRRHAMLYDADGSTNLGALSSTGDSESRSVSFSGRVVGWSEKIVNGGLRKQPFLYDEVGGMQQIAMNHGIEGWAEDQGIYGFEIVGSMRLFDGRVHAWEYFDGVSGAVELLPTLGGWESEALSADDGFIGGFMRDPNGREWAVVWDRFRDPWFVPTPGVGNARITDIATNGRMCGWYEDSQGNARAFLADAHAPTNTITRLPSLGGKWSKAYSLDGGNQVVGSAADAQGQPRAFVYSIQEQRMSDLNERAALVSGRVLTEVVDVDFPSTLAVNGEMNGLSQGWRATRVTLFASTAAAGHQALLSVGSAPSETPVAYVYGVRPGQTAVPGCPGLFADIDQARIAARAVTSTFGSHSQWLDVPFAARGLTIYVQAVLPIACLTTERIPVAVQ